MVFYKENVLGLGQWVPQEGSVAPPPTQRPCGVGFGESASVSMGFVPFSQEMR